MGPFAFRLERILSWRRCAFQADEARLASLLAEQARLEAAHRALLAAREQAGQALVASGAADGGELAAFSGYRARLEREVAANGRQRRDTDERIARQRAQVLEAHRRVRLLEKLRIRRLGEWRAESQREMETFAGEALLARRVRVGGPGGRGRPRQFKVFGLPADQ